MGDYMKFKFKLTFVLRIVFIALTLGWLAFIFSNSLQNAESSGASSGRVLAFLNGFFQSLNIPLTLTHEFVRTLAHFGEFAILGALLNLTFLSFFGVKAKAVFLTALGFCLSAVADECLQLFSDGRAFQLSDLLIDMSGGFMGMTFIFLISVLINNRKIHLIERNTDCDLF